MFKELESKYGFFRVYETGWPKADLYFAESSSARTVRPTVLYSSTFTKALTSAPILVEEVEQLVATRKWNWILCSILNCRIPKCWEGISKLPISIQMLPFWEILLMQEQ